jgi:prolyl-tRNA synthetase
VNVSRDLAITGWGDFRTVKAGEPCPQCGQPLKSRRGIEVGHIFKLGTKYAECFEATYMDDQKQSHPLVMGCYGIGISRTLQAVIEQSHDQNGIIWPWAVAPYQVLITLLDPDMAEARELADAIGVAAELAGADVLVDDRDGRPGVKFKDADLIGFPLRVTIGGRGLKEGIVEVKWRHEDEVAKIPVAEAASTVAALVESVD